MMSDGLRERSKARRRETILRTAYALFADHGFEATTIADIAEVAEVSPRTVTLYFPSKQEMALDRFTAFADRLGTALRERREGWATLDSLEHWLRNERAHRGDLDDLSDRMLDLNPQLKAICRARLAEVIQEGARILAREQGAAPEAFGPRMAAATVAAVIGELGHRPEAAEIDAAMAYLRAALATLSPPPPSAEAVADRV